MQIPYTEDHLICNQLSNKNKKEGGGGGAQSDHMHPDDVITLCYILLYSNLAHH